MLLLCGGDGQRMGGVSAGLPKPMLRVGGHPLLLHIMAAASEHGVQDFVLALGKGGYSIKDYFLHFAARRSDLKVRLGAESEVKYLGGGIGDGWQVSCVDTGDPAGTGTRLRAAVKHVANWPLVVAYGDVLADVDLSALIRFHRGHGRLATVTAVCPPGLYGNLSIYGTEVREFAEKDRSEWVSAGFFVLERDAIDKFIPEQPDVMFENEPLSELARSGELMAFRHDGDWQSVDTPKELAQLQREWDAGGWLRELWKGHSPE
jgi:glucose-1-phosphate cytidylyltransferase